MSGLFISFEGGEGSGKTTQSDLLVARLEGEGRRVVRLHEAGGTPLGEYIRNWVKAQSAPLTPQAELLLFAASRAELVQRVIRPELDQGAIVIADRYADSTTVYQGNARGLPMDTVEAANAIATAGVWPDATFLLDTPPDTGLRRVRVQTSFDVEGKVEPIPPRGRFRQAALRGARRAIPPEGARRLPATGESPARTVGGARCQGGGRDRPCAGVGTGAGTAGPVSDRA